MAFGEKFNINDFVYDFSDVLYPEEKFEDKNKEVASLVEGFEEIVYRYVDPLNPSELAQVRPALFDVCMKQMLASMEDRMKTFCEHSVVRVSNLNYYIRTTAQSFIIGEELQIRGKMLGYGMGMVPSDYAIAAFARGQKGVTLEEYEPRLYIVLDDAECLPCESQLGPRALGERVTIPLARPRADNQYEVLAE